MVILCGCPIRCKRRLPETETVVVTVEEMRMLDDGLRQQPNGEMVAWLVVRGL